MARDIPVQANDDDLPEQTEPSEFDLVRAEARAEVRDLFAAIGLTADKANALGLDLAALDAIDVD